MAWMETTALRKRLLDGLDRFASAMRAEVRWAAAPRGLNPAQDAILRLLLARPAGLRVRALAEHLGVRQPTVTGSVVALERKGLVRRQADPADARATIVKAAPEALAQPAAAVPSLAAAALADLSEAEQASLLKTLIKLIRSLQLRHAIPPQRLCITCKYFRPNVHPEAEAPHHCAFVDAPFGDRALRLDCAEHEQAGAFEMARNWDAFVTPRPRQEVRP
ncbi:MAG: MarR family transcriptional regulator [Pseudomonadota bacterium]|nr:MarR family transcriptional regulator [Pseudomonadota bacterium]